MIMKQISGIYPYIGEACEVHNKKSISKVGKYRPEQSSKQKEIIYKQTKYNRKSLEKTYEIWSAGYSIRPPATPTVVRMNSEMFLICLSLSFISISII